MKKVIFMIMVMVAMSFAGTIMNGQYSYDPRNLDTYKGVSYQDAQQWAKNYRNRNSSRYTIVWNFEDRSNMRIVYWYIIDTKYQKCIAYSAYYD